MFFVLFSGLSVTMNKHKGVWVILQYPRPSPMKTPKSKPE